MKIINIKLKDYDENCANFTFDIEVNDVQTNHTAMIQLPVDNQDCQQQIDLEEYCEWFYSEDIEEYENNEMFCEIISSLDNYFTERFTDLAKNSKNGFSKKMFAACSSTIGCDIVEIEDYTNELNHEIYKVYDENGECTDLIDANMNDYCNILLLEKYDFEEAKQVEEEKQEMR